jgi:hypothetical protein
MNTKKGRKRVRTQPSLSAAEHFSAESLTYSREVFIPASDYVGIHLTNKGFTYLRANAVEYALYGILWFCDTEHGLC